MKKTIKLDLGLSVEGKLFAISSGQKAYKMAYKISKDLKVSLKRDSDLKFSGPANKIQNHLNYICATGFQVFKLIENKGFEPEKGIATGPIFTELKDFDFLFYIESQVDFDEAEYLRKLRTIEGVNLVVEYDPNSLKNKDYLISDI